MLKQASRDLCPELTDRLIAQHTRHPDLYILFITDSINNIYGNARNPYIDQLTDASIEVITTNLDQLQESNPLYNFFWCLLVRPFGNRPEGWRPAPLSDKKITLRSYLHLFNMKANYRKAVIADDGAGDWVAMVLSGSPHNGSSTHQKIAVKIKGAAVNGLYVVERAVLEMCRHHIPTT